MRRHRLYESDMAPEATAVKQHSNWDRQVKVPSEALNHLLSGKPQACNVLIKLGIITQINSQYVLSHWESNPGPPD